MHPFRRLLGLRIGKRRKTVSGIVAAAEMLSETRQIRLTSVVKGFVPSTYVESLFLELSGRVAIQVYRKMQLSLE